MPHICCDTTVAGTTTAQLKAGTLALAAGAAFHLSNTRKGIGTGRPSSLV
jgi:hypothetical protein